MTDRHGGSMASGGGAGSAGSGGAGTAPGLAAGKGGHQLPNLFGFAGRTGNRLLPVGSEEDLLELLSTFLTLEFIDGHSGAPSNIFIPASVGGSEAVAEYCFGLSAI